MSKQLVSATYTHKGWVGICPVYIGGIEDGTWRIDARRWWLEPLHDFSLALYRLTFRLVEAMGGDVAGFPVRITEKMSEPLTVTYRREVSE